MVKDGWAWLLGGSLLLAGCAAPPSLPDPGPWQDAAFAWHDARPTVGKEDLFRLDPALAARLQEPRYQALQPAQRLDELLSLIFGADRKAFRYATVSTVAAETWRARRGDCLSLTVLAFAAARASGLAATMQEVPVVPTFDRRAGYDYVGRHVNLLVRVPSHNPAEQSLRVREVVIDFEPKLGSVQRGRVLTDDAVLARFHSNLGVEAMAAGQRERAYAHFRFALATDPSFTASHTNLAVLYRQVGLAAPAERLLKQAVAAGDANPTPLRNLVELLTTQGRYAEAREYDERLQDLRSNDPYHWTGEGLRWLDAGDPQRAVAALERAQQLTSGFGEVHRYLAVAYWRLGEAARAQDQLARLAALDRGDPTVAKLRRKFDTAVP